MLNQAIESVLNQTVSNVEILVVDDGSPDSTPQVAHRYSNYVRHIRKTNAGLSAARNTGILNTTGEFLQFLDADDYLLPNTLQQHLTVADAHPSVDVFYGTYHYVDLERQEFGPHFDPRLSRQPLHEFLLGNYFPPHGALVRRAAFANVGLFDVNLRSLEDWDMWLRLAASGAEFVRTENVSVPYRQYPASMSKNYDRMRQSGVAVLNKSKAYLHPHCKQCCRSLVNGYWGVRRAFIEHTQADHKYALQEGTPVSSSWQTLAMAAAQDPLLLFSGTREKLRIIKLRALLARR